MKSAVLSGLLLILLFCLCLSSAAAGDWQEVTEAEWQMGPPEEYPQADAVVIFDMGRATTELKGLEFERHTRIKVFNEEGIKKVKSLEVEYFDYDHFFDQKARIYHPDGSIVEFDKNDFETVKTGHKEKATFTFPNVKSGDILEYQYKISYYGGYDKLGPEKFFLFSQEKSYSQYKAREQLGQYGWDEDLYKHTSNLPTWYFDHPVYCLSSTFIAKLGGDLDYSYCTSNMPADRVDPETERIKFLTATLYKQHTWSLTNIEPYKTDTTGSYDDVEAGRIGLYFQLFSTVGQNRVIGGRFTDEHFQHIGESFQGYLSDYVKKTKKMRKLALNLVKDAPDTRAKVEAIYDYVASNYAVEASGYVLRPTQSSLKQVFSDKEAAPFEMNILLVELLKIAHVDAWPVLISTRDKPPFRKSGVFNHMLALIDIDGEQVFADASGKGCALGHLAPITMAKEGVVVNYSDSKPIGIDAQECLVND